MSEASNCRGAAIALYTITGSGTMVANRRNGKASDRSRSEPQNVQVRPASSRTNDIREMKNSAPTLPSKNSRQAAPMSHRPRELGVAQQASGTDEPQTAGIGSGGFRERHPAPHPGHIKGQGRNEESVRESLLIPPVKSQVLQHRGIDQPDQQGDDPG